MGLLIRHFFGPLTIDEVPARLLPGVERYMRMSMETMHFKLDSRLVWWVRAGFTFKKHAPKAGPCFRNFAYLQDWDFDDQPTDNWIVCWAPRVVPGTIGKNRHGQFNRLVQLRQQYGMPAHYLSSRGSVALVAGLIFAYYDMLGHRVPPRSLWVETDTVLGHNHPLFLGGFYKSGLHCANHHWGGNRRENTGCFALAIDPILPGDF